jgi:NAD(P)-dependent dehydrogenase (short-subunit alcohol dehydrogenase family)
MKGMTVDLAGKTALVTGGGGVLCGHMAKALAESGAKVVVADLKKEAAESIVAEIEGSGGTAMAVACNVLEKESLEAALSEVQSAFGPIDILVNGAGGNHPKGTTSKEYLQKEDLTNVEDGFKSFFDLDPAGIEFVFNLNFLGTLLPTQVFSKGMVEKGGGVVINISSMNAFCPLTKIPAYSAAKAAVSNFTQWLAVHFSKVGVRVNAIAPGFFVTAQNKALLMNDDGSLTPRGEAIVNNTPMGRFGDPKELLGTLLWLVSDEASGFVSGTVIPVDGAFAAFSGV